jgi:hypothetical protein
MKEAQFKKQFTDHHGQIFTVNEVIQTPVGLTVYYSNKETQQQYSCLLDAFSERFKELDNY